MLKDERYGLIMIALEDGLRHSRKELVEKTGIQDRQLRKDIAKLRCLGYQIVSDTKKGGYQLTQDREMIESYRKMMDTQRKTIGKRLYMMKPSPDNEVLIL